MPSLSNTQLELLKEADLSIHLSPELIAQIAAQADPKQLSDEQLLEFLQACNALYRSGEPLISDADYDFIFLAELQKRHPSHPYLETVEPEVIAVGKTVTLPEPMLSTEKTYTRSGIEKWLSRLKKAAEDCDADFSTLMIRATPKLDGYAAYDDGKVLYTRGDGRRGTDISRVFERGLIVGGNGERGQGAGEIVVSQTYFNNYLADYFENSRNFQASIIKEKELEQHALEAIQNHAAVFFPFSQLPAWQGTAAEVLADFEHVIETVYKLVDYDVDGVVFELIGNERIKKYLGATRHHHRWQIAYKNNVETAEVIVLKVTPQTSRSGRVNPVAELTPTKLSGAMISRSTAHHYGMVKKLGIGPGTLIELTRSGLVIPKIERVIIPATPQIPEHCPSCGSELVWDSDYLYCLNTTKCPAQIENTIEHFFRTLANVDGFGQKTVEKLHTFGVNSIYAVYQLSMEQLQTMGFGDKTAQNLLDQLHRSRTEAIDDWRFLGAFGIYRMGLGNCERLLQHHHLLDIFNLTVEDVMNIEGFADKTSAAVVECLAKIKTDFMQIYQLGFNLIPTPLIAEQQQAISPISGKTIVFTGTMVHGKRDDMSKQAKRLGAKVASSVTGKTDFLVTGTDVGMAKIAVATEKGVQVISEEEYLALLKQ
ncbi:MAG: helix-hairpin-helix domain-containing protein [Methylobacter sp.]|uniref:helix-hairpin-helix domain-containing protein n=1 Tax=Methylobacter sp. TaxID=2051955 RepID=UPI0025F2CBE5|nr:helix-hairpin-helix domain-containing protein [Methylobacter sp.]MCK9622970.1 helix-hairpin-helix domain-containing protein [Methylobacter sp.]